MARTADTSRFSAMDACLSRYPPSVCKHTCRATGSACLHAREGGLPGEVRGCFFRMPPFAGKTISRTVLLSGSNPVPHKTPLRVAIPIGFCINLMDPLHGTRKQPLPRVDRRRTDPPPLSHLPDRVTPINTLRDRTGLCPEMWFISQGSAG